MNKRVLLAGASLMACGISLLAPQMAEACSGVDTISSNTTISSASLNCIAWLGGNISITGSGSVMTGLAGYPVVGIAFNNGTLTNAGTISNSSGTAVGFLSSSTLGALSNSGLVQGTSYGINNSGTMTTINNSGTISASPSLTATDNTVHVEGAIVNSGEIGGLTNTGSISIAGTISTGYGAFSGTIWNVAAAVANTTGGSIASFINGGTIAVTGNSNESVNRLAAIHNNGTIDVLTNNSNGTILSNTSNFGIVNDSGRIGTLTNNGLISSTSGYAISNFSGTIGTLTNTGSISGYTGITNTGTISVLSNSGTIDNAAYGIENYGRIGTLSNSGFINYTSAGIGNTGTIGGLTNSGTISGGSYGINNTGGSIGTLTNSGTISSNVSAIYNDGTIGTLTNSGIIHGDGTGIFNDTGSIARLSNSGTISGGSYGIYNDTGTIGAITNSGTISSANEGIVNDSAMGALVNSGLIAGGNYAVHDDGTLMGVITNSGTIAGAIFNQTTYNLTINGGSGSTFGTLTGYAANTKGSIANNSADLVFGSGNLVLNDDVSLGNPITGFHTLVNSGATLQIGTGTTSTISVTGNYSQAGGGLIFFASSTSGVNSQLSVPLAFGVAGGVASITGASVTISGSGLTAGETFTIVHSNSLTYSNETYTVLGTAHLTATDSTSTGTDLIVTLVACPSCTGTIASSSSGYTGKGNSAGGAAAGMGPVLDALANSSNPDIQSLLTTIGNMSLAQQKVVLKQLAPTQITPTNVASTQAASPAGSVIEQHELSLLGDGNTGVAAGSEGRDDWVWGQLVGGGSVRASTANQDGSRAQNFGFVVGYDRQVTPSAVLGIAGSVIKSWSWGSDDNSGSLTKLTSYQLLGYGLQRFGQAFVDGQLVYGFNTYDQTRAIGLLGKSAYADYDGYHVSAKLGTGYDIPVTGSLVATPMAGWRFTRATTESYNETGAGAADLSVDNSGVNTLTQDLGVKLSWKTDTAWGELAPEARVAWAHDYIRGDVGASGSMGGVPFATTSERIARDGVRLNLGANLETSDDTTLRLEYEGELRSDYQSHTGLLKFTRSF